MTNDISAENRKTYRQMPLATLVIAVLLCLYWVALFYGTHTKLPPGLLPGNSDKVVHFLSYGGLGALFMSLRATRGTYGWYSVVARWFVLAGYGAFDELTQLLVNRTADVLDWSADICGAAVGLGLVTLFVRYSRRSTGASDESPAVAEAVAS